MRVKKVFVIIFLFMPMIVSAGYQSGKISQLNARSDGLHWVTLEGSHTDKPSCAITQEYWMIKDENSQAGKTQIAMLLSAQASGKVIAIGGRPGCSNGSNDRTCCSRWGDGENIDTLSILP